MTQVNEPPKPEQVRGDVSADREALVDAICNARGLFTPGELAWAGDGHHEVEHALADALIAAGWRRGYSREEIGSRQDYRRGQEDMRDFIADWIEPQRSEIPANGWEFASVIRALPIKGGDD